MTHAESQDLLLDLACGELDAARAAEVETHLSGCPECRKEKAALDEARRMAAPLRELEEPSPGFDERILRAARAQAQLEHDGNIGQVIEVTGSVRPMGIEAARIDAHGPVKARPAQRQRPRWVVRAAVGGSVAAAAALALVVSNTLETRRSAGKAAPAHGGEFEIRVQPAAAPALDSALRDAEAKRAKDQAEAGDRSPPPSPAPQEKAQEKVAELRTPLRKRAQAGAASGAKIEGSGGDAAESFRRRSAGAPRVDEAAKEGARAMDAIRAETAPASSSNRQIAAAPRAAPPVPSPAQQVAAPPPPAASAAEWPAAGAVRPDYGPPAAAMPKAGSQTAKSAPPAPGASGVEANAQQARHSGNYVLAASLYRDAAAMRRREGDPGTAAWDLAHAVECLSAVGRFDEARQVRDELARLHPSETTALAAARRALREVDPPSTLPAAGDPGR